MLRPDIEMEQVKEPHDRRCSSGHVAPSLFTREKNKGPEPVLFFRVSGHGIRGTYCEPCLIVANYISKFMGKKNAI